MSSKRPPFAKILSDYPPKWRYLTGRRLWLAMRLGLYQTVLEQSPIFYSKAGKIAVAIAKLKRQTLDKTASERLIVEILSSRYFAPYHKEFVREVFYLYPAVFVDFFDKNPIRLNDTAYLGRYLGYWATKGGLADIDQYLSNLDEGVDKYCLVNNLCLSNAQEKLNQLNRILSLHHLSPIGLVGMADGFCVANFCALTNKKNTHPNVVSILVTAYNNQQTIAMCLQGLLAQTWQALQIIVIDDASDDRTVEIIKDFAKQDKRICPVFLPKNVGTFVAKNIGAKVATGEFLTCQDADDFAHPQKIERQVLPLLEHADLVATVSHWLRLDGQGNYYARQYYPFLRQNPASPLFRRQKVQDEIGLWHGVRTGADSEFWARLKLVYGDKIVSIQAPLTLASHRENSLMNSDKFGVHQKSSAINRLDYWEAWTLWHIDQLPKKRPLFMPALEEQVKAELFDVPASLLVDVEDIYDGLNHVI